jgi:transcriptional antiterminator NusG
MVNIVSNVYFVVKVTSGQEKIVASVLQNKASKSELPIYSLVVIEGMRGYIIMEAEDELSARSFISRERNVKGILPTPLGDSELDKMIETNNTTTEINIGDVVEFSSGPFKGYKAKVLKVDNSKSEITVELMDVVVPIPITTKMNTAKVVQKVSGESGEQ